MNTADNRLVDEIFSQALELAGRERDEFIRDRCRGNAALQQRVIALLGASQTPDDELAQRFASARDSVWRSVLGDDEDAGEDLSGQRFNAWRLIRRLARGGLATVYLARRDDGSFEQTAAFKVLRRGLDTDDLVSRFRAERQILSSLDHPSIAQILDGGALEDGRPYLMLDYVDGLPITVYCDTNSVPVRGRVALLMEVLHALHHAHRHLIVHRDVKPSNILVSAAGHAVLLDFGIAKLLDPQALPGASTMTRTGVSLLTPGYGSPEQHAGAPVTTASDIYQAGLVMYELLTGARPAADSHRTLDGAGLHPARALQGRPQYNDVRGDLDAITCKATHPDPAQRYASADEMLSDLRRYLEGRPVIARPDTLRYRAAKLARRRPWFFPAIAVALLAVALYVWTLTTYSRRLAHEERLAAASEQFMVDLFRSPDPYAPADAERGRNITVVEALDIGQRRVRAELDDQPELKASLLISISDVYGSLDQTGQAIELREEALALERALHGDQSEPVMASLRALGPLYSTSGDIQRADSAFEQQLAIARELYSSSDPKLGLAEIASGTYAGRKGNAAQSVSLLQQGIDKLRSAPDEHGQALIDALISWSSHYGMTESEKAFPLISEAERLTNAMFRPDSVQAALVRIRLASALTAVGDFEGAEENFLAALPVMEAQLGENHVYTLRTLNNLGYLYNRYDNARAEQIHRQLLERNIAKFGPVHMDVAASYQNLAGAITYQGGRYDESIPLHRKAYEIYREVLHDDHYMIAFPLLSISYAELQQSDGAAAEEAAREAKARFEATVGGSYLEGVARCLLGLSLEMQGRADEGEELLLSSHEMMRNATIPEPYPTLCRLPS